MDPAVLALGGALASAAASLLSSWFSSRQSQRSADQLDGAVTVTINDQGRAVITPIEQERDLAQRASNALDSASEAVEALRLEVEERSEQVTQLRSEQRLLELNAEQVDTVKQALRNELERDSKRSFWFGFAQNLVFFAMGVGATILVG